MITSQTKKDELKKRIEASQLSFQTKEEILTLLSKSEVSDEEISKITNLIQGEIEADFAKIDGLNETLEKDEEYNEFLAVQDRELKEFEGTIKESVAFIEKRAADLDVADAKLTEAETNLRLEDVRGRLDGSAQ